jgi:hypothetical protein
MQARCQPRHVTLHASNKKLMKIDAERVRCAWVNNPVQHFARWLHTPEDARASAVSSVLFPARS